MFWLIPFLLKGAFAAFCGTSMIPYSLEVLPGGGTVLGCARPACFGWDSTTGRRVVEDQSFIQQQDYRDGFTRADPLQREPFMPTVAQTATCFPAPSCGPGQWVSGFVPGLQGAAASLMCCTYPALAQAEDLGVASLSPGTIAYGGEGPVNGPTTHFDYLRNIRPKTMEDGQIGYDVEMSRMQCREPQSLPPVALVLAQQQPPPVAPVVPAYSAPAASYFPALPQFTCFPADAKMLMQDLTEKRMDELKLTEWVTTPSKNHSSVQGNMVKSWLHRMPEVVAEFLVLTAKDGKSIKLTRRHLIIRADCDNQSETETVPAEDVLVGDCLLKMEGKHLVPVAVATVESVWQQGIYAPHTDSGTLIVNGLAVSCFSELNDSVLTRNMFESVVKCSEKDDIYCSVSDSKASLLLDLARLVIPGSKF